MKIEPVEVRYFGYLQGFKVYVNGVKYPRRRKYFYTNMNPTDAIAQALKEVNHV